MFSQFEISVKIRLILDLWVFIIYYRCEQTLFKVILYAFMGLDYRSKKRKIQSPRTATSFYKETEVQTHHKPQTKLKTGPCLDYGSK